MVYQFDCYDDNGYRAVRLELQADEDPQLYVEILREEGYQVERKEIV